MTENGPLPAASGHPVAGTSSAEAAGERSRTAAQSAAVANDRAGFMRPIVERRASPGDGEDL